MKVQHALWPALCADHAANQALHQTLARLEAGTGVPGEVQPAPLHCTALAATVYRAGFKAASLLAMQFTSSRARSEFVELLCIAADAFADCTAGQPPCGEDLAQLQDLRQALAGCRLDRAMLTEPQIKALETALGRLGLSDIGRSPRRVRIMLSPVLE
jgi:hypothetical protein